MHRILSLMVLAAVFAVCTGCTFPGQAEYSLLLQENQRLEHALYVTHSQLADAKRENAALRSEEPQPTSARQRQGIIKPPQRTKSAAQDADEAPAFETPRVVIPTDAPESVSPPDSMKGTMRLPDFPADSAALVPPTWSPVR